MIARAGEQMELSVLTCRFRRRTESLSLWSRHVSRSLLGTAEINPETGGCFEEFPEELHSSESTSLTA